ncbi:hypothetical protein [Lysobacter sp. CFH 32150]|uniref:hypothetical protein n=1 Tax=Lysobacter sp. CFH 32150 TaxID=2927128 RepID=UPI001FA7AF14|nr:hypothetical protein [Lysobacter sp. CFH 32150]MCI4568158.1 hypothetical protein [Lysobacter sp. CFH 32150]
MTIQETQEREWSVQSESSPFAEAEADVPLKAESTAWSETAAPFSETMGAPVGQSESDRLYAEAFAELRDEAFDEAVAFLAEETEQAVADRFTNESPASAMERERYGDAQLSAVRFEAQQYLDALEAGLTGMDVESLSPDQLDEVLERMDPQTGELTPAGEEFIGALVRKAKSVVKVVANTAKSVGKVAGALLGPVLNKLKGLINPLLRRVLSFAIGRLPANLQPAARTLAARFTSEAGEDENTQMGEDEGTMSPANLTDVEALSESFDAALAEALVGDGSGEAEEEAYDARDSESVESRELEVLAEARGVLIDRLRNAGDEEDLTPAIEQFVPALLGALRLGINLVGRPKVVGFLARYLGQLIRRWVGPNLSGPLSNAIVDTGLRLVTLEAEADEAGEPRANEAAPIALATVIEDATRRLAENEDYIFENEDLMQLATADAFGEAVATHFPPRFVRPGLQQAPAIGGTFVARRPRSVRTYRKYSRIPDVEVTAQLADALPTFGGSTVGAVLRAAGATFPFKARMHIYQSAVGTTLPRMVRIDRANTGGGRGYVTSSNLHPLTPLAAGLLLREPKLGVAVPATFLQSRQRIAVGQRFYLLEPLGAVGALALPVKAGTRANRARLAPSRAWTHTDPQRTRIVVGLYLSEAESQGVAESIRQGRGGQVLLQALTKIYGELATRSRNPLHRRLRAWVMPALANWVRANGEAFARAAAHPDAGATIRAVLTSVPGPGARGTPNIAITVDSGKRRR